MQIRYILIAGIPKGINNNLPHVHSVKTNKKEYFESRNTKGYKEGYSVDTL
jgi:hypothetical protein